MHSELEYVTCDLCGAEDSQPFAVLPVDAGWSGQPREFTLVRCQGCGLLYINPRPTQAALTKYYTEVSVQSTESSEGRVSDYYHDYVRFEDSHLRVARRELRTLEKHLRPSALLETVANLKNYLAGSRSHVAQPATSSGEGAVSAKPASRLSKIRRLPHRLAARTRRIPRVGPVYVAARMWLDEVTWQLTGQIMAALGIPMSGTVRVVARRR